MNWNKAFEAYIIAGVLLIAGMFIGLVVLFLALLAASAPWYVGLAGYAVIWAVLGFLIYRRLDD